jgi:hypothetical protein
MKRAVLSGAALLTAFVLPGCPVYPEDRGCFSDDDCPPGALCHSAGYCVMPGGSSTGGKSGSSSIGQCDAPTDCRANETCGEDGRCSTGSCRFHGCVAGFSCEAVEGVWSCVRSSGTGGMPGDSGPDARRDSGRSGAGGGGAGGDDAGGGDATDDVVTVDSSAVDANGSSDSASDATPE